ncbi:cache domain-containing protein [Pseudomonas savastanoi]|uniref:Cache domain-containing protein n=1 Tax=Pseudomonas savastanoi TaxID=29438 RepID=A0AAW5JEI3_PSESS|nr:cache domain-containing protein [Pseudomonas savastanoi]MCQ3023904.1 cache domain-containing protein [Pseudomonas savastanoi]
MNEFLKQAAYSAFEKVFDELRLISSQFTQVIEDKSTHSGKVMESHVKQMRPTLVRALMRLDGSAFSLGIILDENVIPGTDYALSWLELSTDGSIQEDSNSRYPWRGNFYEYSKAEWMNLPRINREPVVVGPYVDFDKYLLTLAVPIIVSDQFIGVAAADVRLDDFERSVAYPLSRFELPCMIVNSEGRVVVSNTTSHPVGSINDAYKTLGTPIQLCGWRIIHIKAP